MVEADIGMFNINSMVAIITRVRAKKIVPNKKEDIGMDVYYLCQPNTYVIAREFGEQQ